MTKSRVPPEKRVRVAQACARCKRRKEKCDGQTPCRNCIKSGVLCMTTTQAQLSGAVGDIRTSEPPAKKQRTMSSSVDRDPFSELLPQNLSYSNFELPEEVRLSPGLPSPISPISDGRSTYGSPRSSSSKSTPVRRTPQKTCPHARTTTEQMANCLRGILLEREGSQSVGVRACCKKTGSGSHADRLEGRMPTYDEMTILLSIFRTHVISIIDPTLDTHFVNLVKTPSFMSHPVNRHCLSELILAISYLCVASSTKSIQRKLSSITPEAALGRASAHFKTAQVSFDMAAAVENPDVSSVEVLLLMGIYKFLEGGEAAASSLIGMAISMAQTLGLNESSYASEEASPEINAGIWNSLYNFDRILSLTASRTCTLPHDSMPISPTSPSSDISFIMGKIIQATRSPLSTPELLQPLSNELKTFITALPATLRWSTILSTSLPQPDLIKSLHINALYFCAIFRLTKTSLLSTLSRSTHKSPGLTDFSGFNLLSPQNGMNYDTLTATHEGRWSEAGIYSAQTSLRIFEKAKQNGITLHGSPLFETWLTLSFLVCILGIFAFPSASAPNLLNSPGGANGPSSPASQDIESRLSQLAHMYQGLISTAKMSPRLCSLSTFINDLRGYLSRKTEDATCGKDSFEALFGSLGDMGPLGSIMATGPLDGESGVMSGVENTLDEVLLASSNQGMNNSSGPMDMGNEDPLGVLLPETPVSLITDTTVESKDETMVVDLTSTSTVERKLGGDVDDLWQKIFEDLDPEDIEPEGLKKGVASEGMGFCIDGTEDMTALERLIRKSEVFV
ncbi:hypothetical protein TWF730_007461 [Orbilia blumenaviensis]|uniref:Zn(2)-C6 fungal-type domain-containing protein n=1 Tax=Orbilia blumenaviensis TaxID=1796055 RepID=A0AAV9VAF5_9PEZI